LEELEGRECPSTLTVTSAADSGAGSLRAEIGKAHNGDTIVFAPSLSGATIFLTSGELLIQKNLTIAGPGAQQLTINGIDQSSRVFEVAAKDTVTLSGLTLSHGNGGGLLGGGILNNGTLTVSGCTFSGNVADGGGAIANDATMTVNGCTFSGNSDGGSGQGQGGAILNYGTATVASSTFTGNSALDGGAIYNIAPGGVYSGKITISGSTFSNNSATGSFGANHGGVIYNYLGSMTLSGCTLSNNTDFVIFNYSSGNTTGPLTINNCTFSGNTAPYTTAIYYIYGNWSGTGNTFN
jgi:hypothetical protein